MNQNLVSAVFDSHSEAERAITELRSAGVRDSALSVVHQQDGKNTTSDGSGSTTDDGGNKSGLVKGLLGGGAVGVALGVAALAIPGVGPLAAAGAIAASAVPEAAAIGAAVGATTGGLSGYLSNHGVDDDDASYTSIGSPVEVRASTPATRVSTREGARSLQRRRPHASRARATACGPVALRKGARTRSGRLFRLSSALRAPGGPASARESPAKRGFRPGSEARPNRRIRHDLSLWLAPVYSAAHRAPRS